MLATSCRQFSNSGKVKTKTDVSSQELKSEAFCLVLATTLVRCKVPLDTKSRLWKRLKHGCVFLYAFAFF